MDALGIISSAALSGDDSGGGAPDWVPANAKIFIEPRVLDGFPSGRAWTEADGIVAVDTLLGSDPNTENGWKPSEYLPENLTGNGYSAGIANGNALAFIGALRTTILDEATAVLRYYEAVGGDGIYFSLVSADGNDGLDADLRSGQYALDVNSWNGPLNQSETVVNHLSTGGAINTVAVTVTVDRFEVAANGLGPFGGAVTVEDRPSSNPLVAIALLTNRNAIQSITIYDPLPSTAGLSALSEIGVTNTAPHDLIAMGQNGNTVDGTTITIADTSIASGFAIVTMDATDDEGNPLTITIVGGADAASFDFGFFGVPSALASTTDLGAGSYIVTLRATDPGGLYVEQTFTITVAA